MTTYDAAFRAVFSRVNVFFARPHTRDSALAVVLAYLLTGCMFGDEPVLTAQKGVAANFSTCVPRECFYGCCQGPKSQIPPQLVGDENLWKARCEKLATTHAAYKEYLHHVMSVDLNYCDNEGGYEWGPCTPIEAKYVQRIGPKGEAVPAGLDFQECPPSGDWLTYPIGEEEIVIGPKQQP